ncbi:MAG: hypothetical protein JKY19_11630, partial [Alcanivoracaceae bacterium]|nr:hypothetical protein [Alcanivoracaceae bacterium]
NHSIANAISQTSFIAENLNDGNHIFNIIAIDATGNLSALSSDAAITINARVPDTHIISPISGQKFEAPILFVAGSADTDLAEITFAYSTDNSIWQDLGTDLQTPYQVTINPIELNLGFGNLYLKATATDTSAQTDASPAQITVEYADLSAPAAISNLTANIEGGQITLNWDNNTETDLQGYIVNRIINAQSTLLTNSAIANNSYIDNGLEDGEYSYQILAIDNANNESATTTIEKLQVFSIQLQQPFSPLLLPAQTQIAGSAINQLGNIKLSIQNNSGSSQLADISLSTGHDFISPLIDLQTGINSISAKQQLSASHQSKTSTIQLALSPIANSPLNFQATANNLDSQLSWQAADNDSFAYLPYRNGQPIYPQSRLTTGIDYQASSRDYTAADVGDADIQTDWSPSFSDLTDSSPTYLLLGLDQPRWLMEIELNWHQGSFAVNSPSAYQIQYMSSVGWITVADLTASDQSVVSVTTDLPYLTDKVRLLINSPPAVFENIRLSELTIKHQPLTAQTAINLPETDGIYNYQLTSINSLGFESAPTASIELTIGDVIAPQAVTLSAEIIAINNVQLNWSASASSDVASYWIFRNDELIHITADETILSYTDSGLANGQYNYHIKAVDAVANNSEKSNIININIQQQALPIPENLNIYPALTGRLLILDWQTLQSDRLHHYNVYRSLTAANNYSKIAESTANHYEDNSVSNGTTYYYVVVAVDEFNNESAYSNEVSAIPLDSVPATTPVITSPTVYATPISLNTNITNIAGISDPGVLIDLYINDVYQTTVSSETDYSADSQTLSDSINKVRLSKRGDWYAYSNDYEDFISQNIINNERHSRFLETIDFSWNDTGNLLYLILYDDQNGGIKLSSYDTSLIEITQLISADNINSAIPSPDENFIFYQGDYTDPQTAQTSAGLWLFDVSDSSAVAIALTGDISTHNNAIAWSADGKYIAFINDANTGELYLYHLATQTLSMIDSDFGSQNSLDWSIDNNTLIYDKFNSNQKLFSFNVNDKQISALPLTVASYKRAHFSADGSQMAYQKDCCAVFIYDFASQTTQQVYQSDYNIIELIWNKEHGIEIITNTAITRLSSPGGFNFNGIILNAGTNQLHAIARDDSGIASQPSLAIIIEVAATGLADILVNSGDIIVSPENALQGRPFVASAIVKNIGDQAIIDAEIQVLLTLPDGSLSTIQLQQNTISLAAGDSQSVFIDIGEHVMIGDYLLQIRLDAQNLIAENNENNNSAYKTLRVLENLDPILQMFVTPEQVIPDQTVAIALSVFNPAENFNGSISLDISDENGFPIGNPQQYTITDLANNHSFNINDNWDTRAVFSGIYQLTAQLIAENGSIIQEQHRQIELQSFAQFQLTLDVPDSTISVNDNLQFSASINYSHGNIPQTGSVTWKILNNNQQLIWSRVTSLPLMLPDFSTVLNSQWQAQDAGDYLLQLEFNANNDQQILSWPFNVLAAQQRLELQGQIANTPTNIILGDDFVIDYTLNNPGDAELNNIPVTITLLGTDSFTEMDTS